MTAPPAPDTSTLLGKVAVGDEAAVQQCIDRFGALVWSLARRFASDTDDAADAVQEIFIALWENAGRYDASVASETTFVAMIARRRLIDRLRKRKRQPTTEGLVAAEAVASRASADPVEVSEEAARVRALFNTLKPEQQEVLKLAVVDGWTHQRISDHLEMPLGTVKTHVRRGLIQVRERMR